MKKMMFLLAMSAVALGGCDWGSKPEKPRLEMSQELKDYTFFRTGSYWIYQDSASQEIDSVYITKMEDYEIEDELIYGYCSFAGTRLYFYSTHYAKSFQQAFAVECNHPKLQRVYINSDIYPVFFGGMYYENQKEVPLEFGDKNWHTTYDTMYANYSLFGKEYKAVKTFFLHEQSSIQTMIPLKSFHAPHIGMLRKEMADGKVWQLVKYQVVQ